MKHPIHRGIRSPRKMAPFTWVSDPKKEAPPSPEKRKFCKTCGASIAWAASLSSGKLIVVDTDGPRSNQRHRCDQAAVNRIHRQQRVWYVS